MDYARIKHSHGQEQKFEDVLLMRRGLGVTDPRDMIFAHTNFCPDASEIDCLQVDYTNSTVDIYTNLALYSITNSDYHANYIFSSIEQASHQGRQTGLPSWVPDWTSQSSYCSPISSPPQPNTNIDLRQSAPVAPFPKHVCNHGTKINPLNMPFYSKDERALVLDGFLVGKIRVVSQSLDGYLRALIG
jgi:hypothetical protein